MGQHAAGMLCEKRQELEFLRRQPDLLAVSQHAKPLPVDHQVAANDRLGWLRRTVDPAQRGANARQQLLGAERLRDVVVGARIERAHLVAFGAARRQHDDRDRQASRESGGTPRRRRCPAGRGPGRRGPAARGRRPRARRDRSSPGTRRTREHGAAAPASPMMFGSSSTIRILDGHAQVDPHGRVRPGTTIVNRAPAPGDVLAPDPAARGGQQPAGDGEPHSGSGGRLSGRAAAIEALEQVIQFVQVEARAVVGDGDVKAVGLYAALQRGSRDRQASTARRSRAGGTARPRPRADRFRSRSARRPRRARHVRRACGAPARRRRRRRRPASPTAARSESRPRRCGPCRGCPGTVSSGDPVRRARHPPVPRAPAARGSVAGFRRRPESRSSASSGRG